eukprot:7013761-Prymnesium_polylepis.1
MPSRALRPPTAARRARGGYRSTRGSRGSKPASWPAARRESAAGGSNTRGDRWQMCGADARGIEGQVRYARARSVRSGGAARCSVRSGGAARCRTCSSFASKPAHTASMSSSRMRANSRDGSASRRSHAQRCDSAQPTAESVRWGEKEPVERQIVGTRSVSAHWPSRIASGCTRLSARSRSHERPRPSTAAR